MTARSSKLGYKPVLWARDPHTIDFAPSVPGPKPLDQVHGVRPKPGLWSALGGGNAVVLSQYAVGEQRANEAGELAHVVCVTAAAWSRSGGQLLTADTSGLAILWDVVSGRAVRKMDVPEAGLLGICSIDWSPRNEEVSSIFPCFCVI